MYRMVVLDLDGTLISGRSIIILSKHLKIEDKVIKVLNLSIDERLKSKMIAELLKGVSILELNDLFKDLINSKWIEVIKYFKDRKMKVGVITITYDVIAVKILENLNLDFIEAVPLKVRNGRIVGDIVINDLIFETPWCIKCPKCKRVSLNKISQNFNIRSEKDVITIGDGLPDACMFIDSALPIAINPKNNIVKDRAKIIIENIDNLKKIIEGLIV
ncbi:MAG: HAD-IB family phosphatase [Candidatus Methanomethylicia archaeon]